MSTTPPTRKTSHKVVVTPEPPAPEPPQPQQPHMMDRIRMKPGSSRVLVEISVSVECGTWGPNCTIDQAVTQAVEDAKRHLIKLTEKESNITIGNARFARVVCDAERS